MTVEAYGLQSVPPDVLGSDAGVAQRLLDLWTRYGRLSPTQRVLLRLPAFPGSKRAVARGLSTRQGPAIRGFNASWCRLEVERVLPMLGSCAIVVETGPVPGQPGLLAVDGAAYLREVLLPRHARFIKAMDFAVSFDLGEPYRFDILTSRWGVVHVANLWCPKGALKHMLTEGLKLGLLRDGRHWGLAVLAREVHCCCAKCLETYRNMP
jgi:hypothetical protein